MIGKQLKDIGPLQAALLPEALDFVHPPSPIHRIDDNEPTVQN